MDTATPLTPEKIDHLLQTAFQFHQEQRLDEAKAIYHLLLETLDAPLLHYNLGLIHHSQRELEKAGSCFERALAGNPADTDSLFNLALCRKGIGRLDEACESYLRLLSLDPEHVDALYNLAGCYRQQRKDQQAIDCYRKVLELAPAHQSATSNLAYMHQLTGDAAGAIDCYRRLLQLAPEHVAARHMLAALLGDTPEAPPESYVRNLFDSYSDHYEESLVENLQYKVPRQLRAMFDSLRDRPPCFQHGIDLGCGTGLSGLAFNDLVVEFDGVDLSVKMLNLASDKGLYSSLFVGSITSVLEETTTTYDFALAADVFAYLGDLSETFRLLTHCAGPDAIFCFSTEAGSRHPYSLQPSGRFAHKTEYVQELAAEFGWDVALQQPTDLRRERDGWIAGNLWILRKV